MRLSVMLMVSCVLTFLILNNGKVEVEAGMRKLGCETLPSNYLGTCGKNGINLCVDDVKKMIVKNTGKAVPKGYGVRCDKCIDEAPKPGYARMHKCVCRYDC
ncbi:hypothetical protein HID58_052824 [Brassica napus]|uniref:Uncharacterized protein n=2 Tax=Brassica TaxID=3705 RepID=A0ABQ8AEA0_BRANA|nr:hypothetical protein HID58_052824 [Brassica napus]